MVAYDCQILFNFYFNFYLILYLICCILLYSFNYFSLTNMIISIFAWEKLDEN